jgi:hypothetical protein
MRLIHAHIMLVNLHLYNLIKVPFRYHLWDSYRAIMPVYAVHFMGQSVFIKLELLHILMDGHSAVLSNEIKLDMYELEPGAPLADAYERSLAQQLASGQTIKPS